MKIIIKRLGIFENMNLFVIEQKRIVDKRLKAENSLKKIKKKCKEKQKIG